MSLSIPVLGTALSSRILVGISKNSLTLEISPVFSAIPRTLITSATTITSVASAVVAAFLALLAVRVKRLTFCSIIYT